MKIIRFLKQNMFSGIRNFANAYASHIYMLPESFLDQPNENANKFILMPPKRFNAKSRIMFLQLIHI